MTGGRTIKLIIDNAWTHIEFESTPKFIQEKVDEALRTGIGIRKDGYQYAKAYKLGGWDGYTPFHEKDKDTGQIRFPTGLLDQADKTIGNLQNSYNFQYELVDNRPDPLLTTEDLEDEIELKDGKVLRDYQYEGVENTIKNRYGIAKQATSSGKTVLAGGLIKQTLPHLLKGETVIFFTHSQILFNQSHKSLEESLGVRVGKIGSDVFDVQQVNVAMIPTVALAIDINVEQGLNLSSKEMVIKKMATKVLPQFDKGVNQLMGLRAYVKNMEVKTKADGYFKDEIVDVIERSESDAKALFNLRSYGAKYKEILKKKNEEKYKKKQKFVDLLESAVVVIGDEAHRVQGDQYYNVMMGCENALIKLGLTGTLDKSNNVLIQRAKAAFHDITAVVTNREMMDRGVSAEADVLLVPIRTVINDGEEIEIKPKDIYANVYSQGVVKNEFRNALTARVGSIWHDKGETVLIIVNHIEHGENLSEFMDQLGVPHQFIHGSLTGEERERALDKVRTGENRMLISSTIMDEGVDISQLSVLINAASGKSLRQVLQRVGRVIRKKEDGRNATVIDFIDYTHEFLMNHSQERKRIYEEEEFPITILDENAQ